jgi:hypothetical protein
MPKGGNRMRDRCFEVVSFFGDSWGHIGWGLFLSWFFLLWFIPSVVLWYTASLLLLVWWVIDAVDREVQWWTMAVVILLLGAGFLPVPRAGWLTIAAWVVYWMRFRE